MDKSDIYTRLENLGISPLMADDRLIPLLVGRLEAATAERRLAGSRVSIRTGYDQPALPSGTIGNVSGGRAVVHLDGRAGTVSRPLSDLTLIGESA